MRDLPNGWVWTTLGEVSSLVRGVSFKREEASAVPFEGLVPVVRAGNLQRGRLNLETDLVWVPEARVSVDQYLRPSDIVVATSSGSLSVVGKSGRVGREWGGAHGAFMSVIRPTSVIEPSLLYWYVQSKEVREGWSKSAAGTSINNLKVGTLNGTVVPLPPLAEQERIVASIEEHLSRLDAAEAALDAAGRRITALEKSILTVCSSTINPPSHWQVVTVGEAGTVALGLQRSPKRHAGPNMRPYLRVANVFEDRIDSTDVMSMNMSEAEWERFRLRDGDVLLNEGQSPELLGRPAIYRGDPPDVAFTNSLIRFQANENVDAEWALLVFRSHMHNRRFMRESQITTNIAHLAAGRFKTVEFPVPPIEEQRARVAVARAQLGACHLLRVEARKAFARSSALRRSILAAAFSGQLVPQDPDDEPASVLLDRIREERAAAAPARKRRAG